MVADRMRITRSDFAATLEVPDRLAVSPAFTDPAVIDAAGKVYPRMVDNLALPEREHPTLPEVIERVRACADLV